MIGIKWEEINTGEKRKKGNAEYAKKG